MAVVGRSPRTHQLRTHLRDSDSGCIAPWNLARGNNRTSRRLHHGASGAGGRRSRSGCATLPRRSRRRANHDDPQKQGARSWRRSSLRRIFRKQPARLGQRLPRRKPTASCDWQTGAGRGKDRAQERAGRGGSAIALRRADSRARPADTALRPGWSAESRLVGRLRATERSTARPRSRSSIGDAPASIDSKTEKEDDETALDENALCDWLASASQTAGLAREFAELGVRHRGLMIESYTSLQTARETGMATGFDPDDFKTSV